MILLIILILCASVFLIVRLLHRPQFLDAYAAKFDASAILEHWADAQSETSKHEIFIRLGGYCSTPSENYARITTEALSSSRAKTAFAVVAMTKRDHDFVFHKDWEHQIGKGLFIGVYRTTSEKGRYRSQAIDSREYIDHLRKTETDASNLSEKHGILRIDGEENRQVEWYKFSGDTYFELMLRTDFDGTDTWIMNVQIGTKLSRSEQDACSELVETMFRMMSTLLPVTAESD